MNPPNKNLHAEEAMDILELLNKVEQVPLPLVQLREDLGGSLFFSGRRMDVEARIAKEASSLLKQTGYWADIQPEVSETLEEFATRSPELADLGKITSAEVTFSVKALQQRLAELVQLLA